MTKLTIVEREVHDLPSAKTPGRILVHVLGGENPEFLVVDYDSDSAVFWIQEGVGLDYFLSEFVSFPYEGLWLIKDITVSFTRGDGWSTDDDEDYEFSEPVPVGLCSLA